MQEFSATITDVSIKVEQNAKNAANAGLSVDNVNKEIEICNSHMNDMVSAMTEINSTSSEIGKIIKPIFLL